MKKNVCHIMDRAVRMIAGLALLSMLLTDSSYKWWGLIGLIPLATVVFGFCPGHALFGINTCAQDKENDSSVEVHG